MYIIMLCLSLNSKNDSNKEDKDIDAANYAVLERLRNNQRREYLKVSA